MGQAKLRGTRNQRIALAQEAQRQEAPKDVPCRTCQALLNDFDLVSTSAAGAAWQKTCACGAVTTAMVQAKHGTLQRAFASTLGLAKTIASDEKKVSVAFLEKTAETVSAQA